MPSGGTRPLDSTSTPVRSRDRARRARRRALGSSAEGTAKATRSWRESSRSDARMTAIDSGSSTPGQVVVVAPLAAMWFACRRCGSRGRPRCPARASTTATAVPQEPPPMTAARRSGGSPPSHSHWSITFGQMRSVTAAASVRRRRLDLREGERRGRCGRGPCAGGCASPCGSPRCRSSRRARRARRSPARAGRRRAWAGRARPGRMRVPSGKIRTASPRFEDRLRGLDHVGVAAPRRTGNAPSELRNQPVKRLRNSSSLAT